MKIEVSVRDLDNVKNLMKVINNKIYEQEGITDYDNELLTALLGENWEDEYLIGDSYME